MNSINKGKRGEREFARWLSANGFQSRRGQQRCGSPDSPDVISDLPFHIEVKRVQRFNLLDACAQAEGDCGGKPWIVAHRRNHGPWMITMLAEEFVRLSGLGVVDSPPKICMVCGETCQPDDLKCDECGYDL